MQLRRHTSGIVSAVAILALFGAAARGDVIVLTNRTDRPVAARFVPEVGIAQQLTLPVGDVVPLFLNGKARIEFSSGSGDKRYLLDANCAYYFGRTKQERIDLQRIGLGEDGTALAGRKLPGSVAAVAAEIPVKILVD